MTVISMQAYREKKEQPKPADLYARLQAKKAIVEHVETGVAYLKRFPRATFPDHEPPGAA